MKRTWHVNTVRQTIPAAQQPSFESACNYCVYANATEMAHCDLMWDLNREKNWAIAPGMESLRFISWMISHAKTRGRLLYTRSRRIQT